MTGFRVLDRVAAVEVRKKQAALRNLLAGDRQQAWRNGRCTATTSAWGSASRAMLACVFGCDALYEARWITVGEDERVQTAAPNNRLKAAFSA